MICRHLKNFFGLSLLFIALFSLSCDNLATPIKEIKSNPEKYENKSVFISGRVVSSQKISPKEKEGSYIIDDGTDQIKVITTKSIPEVGKKVFIKGTVSSNFVLFGKHFGIAVKED